MPADSDSGTLKLFLLVVPLILASGGWLYWYASHAEEWFIEEMIASGSVELLTIDAFGDSESNRGVVQGRKIVDSRTIDDPDLIRGLLAGVVGGNPDFATACFVPRHAVRVVSEPEKSILICLECSGYQYSIGKKTVSGIPSDSWNRDLFEKTVEDLGMIQPSN